MVEELQELHEHAEEAREDPAMVSVTISMAILAVLVAAASLLGHRAHTEELLLQTRATDQWAYYQAKGIRRHSYEQFLDLIALEDPKDQEVGRTLKEKYARALEESQKDQKKIEEEARGLETETGVERRRADRFDLGEVCLEAALVITSLTLLTRKRAFWRAGIVVAAAGALIAATGFFVH
jgi:hypothetical protein